MIRVKQMLNKVIDHQYKRVIAKGIVVDMITEILGCLDMIAKDITDEKLMLLDVHTNLFIGTVEQELELTDKITMYTYARGFCMHILDERKHTREIRQLVHGYCRDLEKRIVQLNKQYQRTGNVALRKAYEKIIKDEYATDNPNYPLIDRTLLLLKDMGE